MTRSAYATFEVIESCELSLEDASARVDLSRPMRRWSWRSGELARTDDETAHETRVKAQRTNTPQWPCPSTSTNRLQSIAERPPPQSFHLLTKPWKRPKGLLVWRRGVRSRSEFSAVSHHWRWCCRVSSGRWGGYTTPARLNLCLNLGGTNSKKRVRVHPSRKPWRFVCIRECQARRLVSQLGLHRWLGCHEKQGVRRRLIFRLLYRLWGRRLRVWRNKEIFECNR